MGDYLGYSVVSYAEPRDDETPTTDEWVERCPVCEGVDFPGLSHNPKAPYCNGEIAPEPHDPHGWAVDQ